MHGWAVDGQLELQIVFQRFSSVQRPCKCEEAQLVEARVGPSSLVKICVWMMSGWTAEIAVASPQSMVAAVVEVEQLLEDIIDPSWFRVLNNCSKS